jgi:tyrosinase
MERADQFRRNFMKSVLGAAAAQGLGLGIPAFAQSGPRIRTEWQQFKKTAQYKSFLNAIAAMRKNNRASSPGSLQYWANVHMNYCPHGSPYFLSWHRGYLYYFEQQLRTASGDPTLNLPYWDYYSYSTMPAEFTDSSAGNPLYLSRTGSNVYNALTLWPFAPEVYNFQRGTTDAFEVRIETAPHNPVHDMIGGVMSTMQSPLDPIFFLHHANIDRLTHAWALPDGKGIPDSANPYSSTNSSPYWGGNNTYAPNLTMARYLTLIPTWLGYDYANDAVPTALPPMAVMAQASGFRLPAGLHLPSPERPPARPYERVSGRTVSRTRRSLGGAARLGFDETSFSTVLDFDKKDALELAALIARRRAGKPRDNDTLPASAKLVLDRPALTEAGSLGGYYYALYVNMPPVLDSNAAHDRTFLGTLGAFQIASASHHGPARLEYDLADLLIKQGDTDFPALSLSWVRVDGDNPPHGRTISVPEARVELSYEAEPVEPPRLKGRPGFYS